MASRVAGALLALTAAALLAVSVVVTAWWSGHPSFNGTEIKAKEIHVGPLGATGCNTGGDGACMGVPVDATFETVGYALAGVSGLLALAALLLSISTARVSTKRKSLAIFVIVGSVIAALLALVLVVVGPKLRTEAPLPFAPGLFLYFGGITSALASSVFAMRTPSHPRMQLAPARQSVQQMQPAPMSPRGGLDVGALLAQDALRPSSLGPEPRIGRGSPVVQSPGGALAGPSGPLGAPGGAQPLFSSAPHLRPLYDVAPGQGGTGGFVPKPPQNIPLRAPTPIPRDQISAHAGIPTPASIEAQRSVTMAGVDAPPSDATDRDLLGVARGGPKPSTLPPPIRNKPASMSPPVVAKPLPTLAAMSAVPPPPNTTLASKPPAEESVTEDSVDEPFDAMQTYQREPAAPPPAPAKPAVPMPAKPAVPMPAKPAALAKSSTSSLPMPAKAAVPLPAKPALKPVPRPSPAPLPRAATPRPPTRLATEDVAIDTDVSAQAIDERSPPTETFESETSESTNFTTKPRAPSASSTMQTQAAPPDDAPADDAPAADDEPIARDKVARTDRELPTARPPTETSPPTARPPTETSPSTARPPTETSPSTPPAPAVAITPAVAEAPNDLERPSSAKLPISTAPDSLPPPTEKQSVASGPSPACPQCEAPMAWVEAHLRFYCKSCKMYF